MKVRQFLVDLASILFGKATNNSIKKPYYSANLSCIEANDVWLNLYPFHVFKQTQSLLPLGFATGQQCVESDVTWLYLRVSAVPVEDLKAQARNPIPGDLLPAKRVMFIKTLILEL